MKAWIVFCGDEYCTLIHADTAGKAKRIMMGLYGDETEFIDYRATRFPKMDDKKFTYEDCKEAGWEYLDGWDGGNLKKEDFINDCPCNICTPFIK